MRAYVHKEKHKVETKQVGTGYPLHRGSCKDTEHRRFDGIAPELYFGEAGGLNSPSAFSFPPPLDILLIGTMLLVLNRDNNLRRV